MNCDTKFLCIKTFILSACIAPDAPIVFLKNAILWFRE